MEDYVPTGPYVIGSGKRAGKTLENLMFDDYSHLIWLLNFLRNKAKGNSKNKLHTHLEWLLRRGQGRKPKMLCPHCKQRIVTRFSVLGGGSRGISVGAYYTCCDDDACKDKIDSEASGNSYRFLPFDFIVLKQFQAKFDQKQITDLFRCVFELPKPLKKEKAFAFFNDD